MTADQLLRIQIGELVVQNSFLNARVQELEATKAAAPKPVEPQQGEQVLGVALQPGPLG